MHYQIHSFSLINQTEVLCVRSEKVNVSILNDQSDIFNNVLKSIIKNKYFFSMIIPLKLVYKNEVASHLSIKLIALLL